MTTTWHAPFARQRDGRLLGGVAVALARRWRLDPGVVRFGFLVLGSAAGIGVVVYVALWLVCPLRDDPDPAAQTSWKDSLAAVVVLVGALLVLRTLGVWFSDRVAVVGAVAALGISLVWGRTDRLGVRSGERSGALRLAAGLVLLVLGFGFVVVATTDLWALGRTLFAALVAMAGLLLVLAPWLVRTADDLRAERRQRVRSEERAEIAAHLHDGVLQTLALIQRQPGASREVVTLARRQERELRTWLYGLPAPSSAETLAAALRSELAAVEDDHGVRLEVVVVGDAPLDERMHAVVGAVREAASNAARHAGVDTVDVYVEVLDDRVEAFVRDRGRGFEQADVAPDRMGLVESVTGRVRRAGGSATVLSRPGEGTEVAVVMPRHRS